MDIRFILRNPLIYKFFSSLVGQGPARQIYVDDFFKVQSGTRMLDIGCGPADILHYLPTGIDYTGLDMSQLYIDDARKEFGNRGTFICDSLNAEVVENLEPFDLVVAIGVVHHLNDIEAASLFEIGREALKPGGRLVTVDPVFFNAQSRFEHLLVSKDRGQYVRYPEQYLSLAGAGFTKISDTIRSNLLRMPWSLMFMECEK